MNREVYKELLGEIENQKNTFERIGSLVKKIDTAQVEERLEKLEAAFEFFIYRMLFAFRNDEEEVVCALKKLLNKAVQWELVKEKSDSDEKAHFLDGYFSDINMIFNEIIEKAERFSKNDDRMGLAIIVKNEERYLPEWIEYHKAVGITRFFIYDNESTDNTKEVLQQYIDEGSVTYTWCPGKVRQLPAYANALDRFRYDVKYMGFIDTDEFILPVKGDNIPDLLDELFEKYPQAGGIAAGWRIFGSDGVLMDDGKPVIGAFLHRADNSFWQHQHIKSLCDPRKTICPLSAHHFEFAPGYNTVNERGMQIDGPYDMSGENQDCSYFQINHYYVKSREYWDRVKMKRGFADMIGAYEDKYFDINDRNEIEDKRMLKYLPVVEKRLRERGLLHERA